MPNSTIPAADTSLPNLSHATASMDVDGRPVAPSLFTLNEKRIVEKARELIEKKCLRAGPILGSAYDLERYLVLRFAGLTNEQFHVLYLDGCCRLLEVHREFYGRQRFVGVDIRQVVLRAILLGAEHVVFAHNHPSGGLVPSKQDIDLSIWCEGLFEKLNIKLLDSIVVTSCGTRSINSWRERDRKEQEQRERDKQQRLKAGRPPKGSVKEIVRPRMKKTGPMMSQHLDIKAANPGSLVFYRMGDFYELFFDDAKVAAKALGIVLTTRGKHEGDDIAMCGIPAERAQEFLERLVGLGHCVAVCERAKDPAEALHLADAFAAIQSRQMVTPG